MADQENSGKEQNMKRMADQKFKKYGEAKKMCEEKNVRNLKKEAWKEI